MRNLKTFIKKFLWIFIAICFWIVIWHFYALKVDSIIFLPTPKEVFLSFTKLIQEKSFLVIIGNSFIRIVKGFIYGIILGVGLAMLAYFIKPLKVFINIPIKIIKAVPVASFIILALLWIESKNLATFISAIMVLPVIYINVLEAFEGVSEKMLEVSKVFQIPIGKKIRYIYLPEVMSGFIAGSKIALGFCFKAGIAAEVIGLPTDSIGAAIYESKLYLDTERLFAWTVVILFLSVGFECIWLLFIGRIYEYITSININKLEKKGKGTKNDDVVAKISGDEIWFENITKNFGDKIVLCNKSILIKRGTILFIKGDSGVGKTTFGKIVLGLIKDYKGEINPDISCSKAAVFQEDRLIDELDIYTNIYLSCKYGFAKDRVDEALKKLGVKAKGGEKIKNLSGGMKRRVAVIRAVMSQGEILVFDEPFAGLDSDSKKRTYDYIKENSKNKFTIIITHDEEKWEKIGENVCTF